MQEGSHALPGVSPPRGSFAIARHRLRIGALWRGRPAGAAARVLAGSSKLRPSRSLPFPRRSKRPAGSHSASVRFLIAADRHIPSSQCSGCLRRRAGGMGELFCPGSPSDKPARAREPGAPTAPDCSPVTRRYRGVTWRRRCRSRGRRKRGTGPQRRVAGGHTPAGETRQPPSGATPSRRTRIWQHRLLV
jgi:hypothetical protein